MNHVKYDKEAQKWMAEESVRKHIACWDFLDEECIEKTFLDSKVFKFISGSLVAAIGFCLVAVMLYL